MHLAINYSHPAASLVKSGTIEVDFFKVPDWDWIINEANTLRPVAVHFTLEAGNGGLDTIDWDRIRLILESTKTPYVNLHLDAKASYYPGISVKSTHQPEIEFILNTIRSDIRIAVEKCGADRVIIENSPYQENETGTMKLCVIPAIIRQVVEDTGCNLLLDISHAIISAKTLGIDPADYIAQLPVERIKELHFAGVHYSQTTNQYMDHLSIQEEDWGWLNWALSKVQSGAWNKPWLLAFEYGGVGEPFAWRSDPLVMTEQVPRLYNLVKNIQA